MSAAPDSIYTEALDFLRRVVPPVGGFNIVAIDPDREQIVACAFTADTIEQAPAWIDERQRERKNIYWSVNPLRSSLNKKAEKKDVAAMAWLHVDIDDTSHDVLERLRASRPAPTFVVFSGGGYQAFWKLEERVPVNGSPEPLEDYNRYLEHEFAADHCHNIDRIMRVPGTTNFPNAKKRAAGRQPVAARLVEFHDERTYELADFTPMDRQQPAKCNTMSHSGIGEDRSNDLMARVGADVRAGMPDYQIIAKHREHPHARDQSDADRAVRRCIERARTDIPARLPEYDDQHVRLRAASEIVATVTTTIWLIACVLEAFAIGIMFGDLGTFKSFLALDWSLHIAAGRKWLDKFAVKEAANVVYIHAEGRGLGKRIRGWCLHHKVDVATLKFYAVEHLLDLSSDEALTNLIAAIDALAIKPAFIVVDTLSRNCGPLDEDKSKDMAPFINRLDRALRVRYGCTVLFVHHTGHGAKERTRGTYVLLANTDSNYRIERPDPEDMIIKITTGRLKDSESPEPIYAIAKVVDLGTQDAEGKWESTLVLLPTQSRPVEPRRQPSGRQQGALLKALEDEYAAGRGPAWPTEEVRRIARERVRMHRNSALSAVVSLTTNGFLKNGPGGLMLASPPERTK
jgi:hypothetical protein